MKEISRRRFIQYTAIAGASLITPLRLRLPHALAAIAGGTLDPTTIPKYVTPLVVPPAMPRSGKATVRGGKNVDLYDIAVREFQQHVLPPGMGLPTTVWSYGSVGHPGSFHYPAFTIEAKWKAPARVTWTNQLYDGPWGGDTGRYLPHLLAVDQTVHWANPPGGPGGTDRHAMEQEPYTGPVPIVTHLHGGHTAEESDGYAEAWYLPAASDLPAEYATSGSHYPAFKDAFAEKYGIEWAPGSATFQYDNDQDATTLWYHDHTLGMTRLNVYAGPAGFYIVRGGPRDEVGGVLPGPAPALGDPVGMSYYEIPIVVQDRSFDDDGSLFYPDNRAFFEGLELSQLEIPFVPDQVCDASESDISPIWNPEFFGNTMVVNGRTWPHLDVEQRRYRFRFLNGCQSRFLILDFSHIPGVEVWQIGNEGGFLGAPVDITALGNRLLMGLAERADVIVDFANVPPGSYVLGNVGPDEPFGGGIPDDDFDIADPASTGQVMQFRVAPALAPDPTTPPQFLVLPPILPLPAETATRPLALIEKMGMGYDANGEHIEGPLEALLGRVGVDRIPVSQMWMEPVTENPAVGDVELWEFYNTTGDAHPMHVHEVVFEVVNREGLVLDEDDDAELPIQLDGNVMLPEPWESGFKDTVIAYPGQVTRIRMQFNTPGQFVWHCHIVEHEDNEMMRPYRIGPEQPGQP
jgi:FtsP/CotA-like multicopper oxidase with cupredoxin domain